MQRNLPHKYDLAEEKPVQTVGAGFGPAEG